MLVRLGHPFTQQPIATRLAQQVEARLTRGQLKAAQMLAAAWGLYELAAMPSGAPKGSHPLAEKLRSDSTRAARAEGPEGLCACFRQLSALPLGRWPLLEGVIAELCATPRMESQLLCDTMDALARLRYDAP